MVVYIEYILLNNFVIDYVLIYLLSISFGIKYGRFRVFLTLCIALCIALVMPYIEKYNVLLMVYKLVSLCIVILPLKKYRDIREYMAYYFMTILYTFLLGGCMYGVMSIFDIKMTLSGVVVGGVDMPSTFVYIVVGLFVYIFVCVLKYIFSMSSMRKNYYDITISIGDKYFKMLGYLDTGNFVLKEDKGVVFISKNIYRNILDSIDISKIQYSTIDVTSVGKSDSVTCIRVDSMCVDGRQYTDIPCGVVREKFLDFDCILHSQYIS